MGMLDPQVFLSPGAIGAAIEVTVASIASPTELNARPALQGDIILARTIAVGTDNQTWYYADTTSAAESLPYIVSSATAGVKFIAFGGRYNRTLSLSTPLEAASGGTGIANTGTLTNATNTTITGGGTLALGGYTLTVPATGTAGLLAVANTWTAINAFTNTTSASSSTVGAVTIGDGVAATSVAIGGGNINAGGGMTAGSASAISYTSAVFKVGNGAGAPVLQIDGAASLARSVGFYTGGVSRWQLLATSGAESGANAGSPFAISAYTDAGAYVDDPLNIVRAAGGAFTIYRPVTISANSLSVGTTLYVASTTDAVSKDTGAIIAEGGLGVEKSVFAGASFAVGAAGSRYNFSVSGVYLSWIECDGIVGNNYMRFGVANTEWMRITQDGIVSMSATTDATSSTAASVTLAGGFAAVKRSFLGTIATTFSGNVIAAVQDGTADTAGAVGEVTQGTNQTTYTNFTTTNTYQQLAVLTSLARGRYRIVATVTYYGNAASVAALSEATFAISTTTASAAGAVEGRSLGYVTQQITSSLHQTITLDTDINISAATSYYFNGKANFTGGNPQWVASITAYRLR